MTINEIIRTIKSKPPLTLAQARIASLKRNSDAAKGALKREREHQAQQRELQATQKLRDSFQSFSS